MPWARAYPAADDVPTADWSPGSRRLLEPPYVQGRADVVERPG